jgi:lysophospholipase L1-like esterase
MPGIHRDATFETNALGIRGRLPGDRDESRTLVIGGSTAEDMPLDWSDCWAGRLERLLGRKTWVGNAGRSGMRVHHATCQLEELLPALPKINRVLVLAGLNDMLADYGLHMSARRLHEVDNSTAFGFVNGEPLPGDASDETDLGAVITVLKQRYRRARSDDFVTEARHPPSVGLDRFKEEVRALAAMVRQSGTQPIFLTQPALWSCEAARPTHFYAGGIGPSEHWFARARHPYFAPALLQSLLDGYNDALHRTGERVIDLAAHLPVDPALFYDDFHFSKAGAASVASIVAGALQPPKGIYPLW